MNDPKPDLVLSRIRQLINNTVLLIVLLHKPIKCIFKFYVKSSFVEGSVPKKSGPRIRVNILVLPFLVLDVLLSETRSKTVDYRYTHTCPLDYGDPVLLESTTITIKTLLLPSIECHHLLY